MHVDPAQAPTRESLYLDEREHFFMSGRRHVGKLGQGSQNGLALGEMPAGELSNHERMGPDVAEIEKLHERRISLAQVIDPDRRVDEHLPSTRARPPAGYGLKGPFRTPQGREPPSALASDQGPQSRVKHGGLFPKTRERPGFREKLVVDDQCRPHVHEYGSYMHIRQGLLRAPEARAPLRKSPRRCGRDCRFQRP